MGFFDFVKATFSKGGIKVRLAVPKQFTWGDASIPVTVTLTGHKSEPRTITALGFTVEDEQAELTHEKVDHQQHGLDNKQVHYGNRVRVVWEREGSINLAPGETITLEVPVALTPGYEFPAAQVVLDEQIPDTTMGRVLRAAKRMALSFAQGTDPSQISKYLVTVHARVEGAKNVAAHSRPIRQGRVSRFG